MSVLQARGILARAAAVVEENGAPPLVAKNANDSCVFYDADHSGLCVIHRDGGPHLMPSACRNFPRVSLRDARGVFVTLSHYCPTAAGLLVDARDIAIVPAPSSLSLDGDAEGLDATAVMPPLLRRGMLMDFDGYAAWEQEAIAVFDAFDRSPRLALAVVAAATADACTWRPEAGALAAHLRRAFHRASAARPPDRPRGEERFERPMKAFAAAHLFASWAGYQDGGLTAIVRAVESALSQLESQLDDRTGRMSFIAAVRSVDLRLRHETVPASLTPDS